MQNKIPKRLLFITLTIFCILTLCGIVSAASTVYVNETGSDISGNGSADNPYQTVNYGISKVDSAGTVNIGSGTFDTYINNTSKNYNITISKNVNIKGAGQNLTFINATGLGRIFTINSGYTVTISDLTITDGKAPDGTTGNPGTDGGNGGAIINSGTLTLNNVTISNSRAGNGGNGANGVNSFGNRAGKNAGNGGNGGAIYNTGTITINDSILSNNTAGNGGNGGNPYSYNISQLSGNGGNGGNGGAIYSDTTKNVNINRSILINNTAGNGGNGGNGYWRGNGGNGGEGGAIYITGSLLDWADLNVFRSSIINNTAGNGGLRGSSGNGGSNGNNGEVGGIFV
ncbi:MAG TPA: hypothetical protein VK426_06330, partial [Methanobacterium sp.]|nr:hypothetical protein [Methanobacterium sp.]